MTDLNARSFMRRGATLVPVDRHALEWLEQKPEGRELLITSRRARSPQHHRRFFALLHKVVEAAGTWRSENELLDAIKQGLGFTETRNNIFGKPYQAVKSISFVAMDQDEFRIFTARAMDLIAAATGIDPEDLMREVNAEEGTLDGRAKDTRTVGGS